MGCYVFLLETKKVFRKVGERSVSSKSDFFLSARQQNNSLKHHLGCGVVFAAHETRRSSAANRLTDISACRTFVMELIPALSKFKRRKNYG